MFEDVHKAESGDIFLNIPTTNLTLSTSAGPILIIKENGEMQWEADIDYRLQNDNEWLHVLKCWRVIIAALWEAQKANIGCNHELIDITNEVVKGGYMCKHCGNLYRTGM